MARFRDPGGNELPPITLDLTDIRDIFEMIKQHTGYFTTVYDANNKLVDLDKMGELSKYALSEVRIEAYAPGEVSREERRERYIHLYLSKGRAYLGWGAQVDPQGSVRRRILQIARRRLDVGVWVWASAFAIGLTAVGLMLWYAADVGFDIRLLPPTLLGFGAALWALARAAHRVDVELSKRWNGARIRLYSRAQVRRDRGGLRREIILVVSSVLATAVLAVALWSLGITPPSP